MRTAVLALLATSAAAADLSGTWLGAKPDLAFYFKQTGAKLTGKMYGDYQSTPLSDGIVSGDSVTFIVNLQEQAGNQINDTRVRFTGKLAGGELELIRERESSTNAGNGGRCI